MNAPIALIIYSIENRETAERLQNRLADLGLAAHPDQTRIHEENLSREAFGMAVSSCDLLLMIWDSAAAASPLVSLAWTTALTLKKTIVPCLLDDTPLPDFLASVPNCSIKDFETGVSQIRITVRLLGLGTSGPNPPASTADVGTIVRAPAAQPTPSGGTPAAPAASPVPHGDLLPGQQIGTRYRIISLLGRGGMGAVYKAYDNELERDVALKVIRADMAEDPEVLQRFKREIQLSSVVTHKNVLRIYDLGEIDGLKFLTMQFVEGEDLAQLFKREEQLPLDRVLNIFQQICHGLGAAHERGILHRDLKPSNIMIDREGTVYLTDFGLARSVSGTGLTQTGALMGTPDYMSPEQVKGEPLDVRSDLYSLGIILYQMVTNHVPYSGNTVFEVMIQRVQKPPRPASELNPDLPPYLDKIVRRCMTIEKQARYASMAEILADLEQGMNTGRTSVSSAFYLRRWRGLLSLLPARRIAIVLPVIILLAVGVWWIGRRSISPNPEKAAAPAPVSVLVADFQNRTGDPVFDGTLEPTLTGILEEASFITSYSRSAARRIAAQQQPGATRLDETIASLVAVREGVNVVVSGSISGAGGGYDIAVKALDAIAGKVLLAENDRADTKEAVLPLVGKLAAHIRKALGDDTPESLQLAAAETFTAASLHVAHVYAQAQESAWAGNWEKVIEYNQQAIELDPNFGRAYAALAVANINLKRRDEAAKYYTKALALIDRMSSREKYRTLGAYYLGFVRNFGQALEQFRKLVELFPGDSAGHNNLAIAYVFSGKIPEAVDASRRAVEVSPRNLQHRLNFALFSMYSSDFETAVTEANRVLDENSAYEFAYLPLALSKLALGDVEGAREAYSRLRAVSSVGASLAAAGEADLEMYLGRYRQAASILEAGIAADKREKSLGEMGLKYLALAETEFALGRPAKSLPAAEMAVQTSRSESVVFPAALLMVQAGNNAGAEELSKALEQMLQDQTRAYARLITAEIAVKQGRLPEAVEECRKAISLHESWIGHFLLGRTYVEAGHYAEALSELEACWKRRGETTDLCFADTATLRYLPPLYYWLGRAQEGMGMKEAAMGNYQAYLKLRAGGAEGNTDPLASDALKRSAVK